jgi:hypothetical protein
MSNDAEKVVVGITGAAYVADTTQAGPTTSAGVPAGFTAYGYVTQDGIEFATDKGTAQIRAWQNSDLVREVITEATVTYSFALMESNEAVIESYFGSPMIDGKIEFKPNETGGRKSFVFDVIDGDKKIRHYIPRGEITQIAPQTWVNGEAVVYGFTVTAYATDGVAAEIFYGEFEDAGS